MKRLVRFLSRLTLMADRRRDGNNVGTRAHVQADKDLEWQNKVGEAARPKRENPSSQWFRH